MIEAGPLVQLRISLSRVPLRIAPAWSVLAGALSVAAFPADGGLWLRVVAALILGDLAWGILRQYAQARAPEGDSGPLFALPLPYAHPDAPLSRLLGGLVLPGATWHGAVAGVLLALGGGLLLGWAAVALSAAAILATGVAGPLARRGDMPAGGFALLDVLLPWLLGMVAAGWPGDGSPAWAPVVVACALTLLQWGALRAAWEQGAPAALGIGALAVVAAQVALAMPGAAAISAVLTAPALYWLGARGSSRETRETLFRRAGPWLMLVLFVAALAVR